ncbi:unnamed protein product [Trichogramma brassicae]|uniref:Uncharacterized protein n=1 Tax=Trichogramma brassicae TaxID=86971 RepID=A0A6H5IJE9_9HYME|nr:unnamed protein product [Trichogramma brassicae]
MSSPKDEESTIRQAQIEATRLLDDSIKELQSRVTSLEEKPSEKNETKVLQQISKSITKLQRHSFNQSGKPGWQKRQETRKNKQQRTNALSTQNARQQAVGQPSRPTKSPTKKTQDIRCYKHEVPNEYRKNCAACSDNSEIGKVTSTELKNQQISTQARQVTTDEKNAIHSSSGYSTATDNLEGHWQMQVQVGDKQISGLYDTGGERTTMREITAMRSYDIMGTRPTNMIYAKIAYYKTRTVGHAELCGSAPFLGLTGIGATSRPRLKQRLPTTAAAAAVARRPRRAI